jgi:hypothetical protein
MKLSALASSHGLPRRPIEPRSPCSASFFRYGSEAYREPLTPFCVSSGDSCLVDLASALVDQSEQLARDVALQAA